MAIDTLGCGTYEVYFKYRGGHTFLGRARDFTALRWSRVLNDVSDASVTISLRGTDSAECCGLAATVNPWEHEMSIYRDGQEVWCGPVTGGNIDINGMSATFDAKDLSSWFDHRWVEVADTEVEFDEVDITLVFDWLIGHGYYKDPFNLQWFVGPELGIPITRSYLEFTSGERWGGVYPMIGEQIKGLVDSRIDYTTIRRVLVAGDLQTNSAAPVRLTEKHWVSMPNIVIVGNGMATEQAVGGSNGGYDGYADEQLWIERPFDEFRERFGLLQNLEPAPELDEEDTTTLPNAITQRAYELRGLRREPYVYLSAGSLASDAPVTFDQLIPGRNFSIELEQACRPVRSQYLLRKVDTAYGSGGEVVTLELVPPGLENLKA